MRSHTVLPLLLAGAALCPAAATAQVKRAGPPPKESGSFAKVIGQPTGQNGYEELVLAGDVLASSKLFKQAELLQSDGKLTLTLRRQVLQDKAALRALTLLRAGVNKPISSPRQELTFSTLLPELSQFRSLGRLLAMQQYVQLADGKTADAIHTARLVMRLGQVVQTDTLISGLVGVAISALGMQPLGARLDQLAARDCELLYDVCLEWMRAPDPYPRVLEVERRAMQKSLQELIKKGPAAVADEVVPEPGPDDQNAGQVRALRGDLKAFRDSPEAREAFFRDVVREMDRFYEKVMVEARKPAWQRGKVEPEGGNTLASRMVEQLVPALSQVSNAYTRELAKVRLLACHAAIRRYRWEHDRLPPNLAGLTLAEVAVDPFTGQPLQYRQMGARYQLHSAGPETTQSDNPKVIDGRLPISVVPDE